METPSVVTLLTFRFRSIAWFGLETGHDKRAVDLVRVARGLGFQHDSSIDNCGNRLKYWSLRGMRCFIGIDPGDSKDRQAGRLSFPQKIAARIK